MTAVTFFFTERLFHHTTVLLRLLQRIFRSGESRSASSLSLSLSVFIVSLFLTWDIRWSAAFVPFILPDCVQHLLHVAAHPHLWHFWATFELWCLTNAPAPLQVSEAVTSCLVCVSVLCNMVLFASLRRDVAKNARLSWAEFVYWIASGRSSRMVISTNFTRLC